MPSLGFGGKTVGLGPIFRAGSTMNRPTPGGLLLVAAVDGAVGMTATGTTATAASSAALLLGCVTTAVVLEVDNSGTDNGEEERC